MNLLHKLLLCLACTSVLLPATASPCKPDDYKNWMLANAGIYGAKSDYPPYARAEKRQGRTTVSFVIGADGTVTGIKTMVSSGYSDLDHAARTAYVGTKAPPLMCDGKPYSFSTHKTFDFSLPPEPPASPPSRAKRERIQFIIGKLKVKEHVTQDEEEFYAGLPPRLKMMVPGKSEAQYQQALDSARDYLKKEHTKENNLEAKLIQHFNQRFTDEEIGILANLLAKPDGRALLQKLSIVEKDAFALTSRWIQRTAIFGAREAVGSLGGRLSGLDQLWADY